MRLIDADKLNIDFYDEYETEDDAYAYGYVSKYQIDTAPTIEIIRCGECKRWSYSSLIDNRNRCERTMKLTKADDFCSYGKRRGSEKPNNSEIPTGSERGGE